MKNKKNCRGPPLQTKKPKENLSESWPTTEFLVLLHILEFLKEVLPGNTNSENFSKKNTTSENFPYFHLHYALALWGGGYD